VFPASRNASPSAPPPLNVRLVARSAQLEEQARSAGLFVERLTHVAAPGLVNASDPGPAAFQLASARASAGRIAAALLASSIRVVLMANSEPDAQLVLEACVAAGVLGAAAPPRRARFAVVGMAWLAASLAQPSPVCNVSCVASVALALPVGAQGVCVRCARHSACVHPCVRARVLVF
jgi:hypothetical protein